MLYKNFEFSFVSLNIVLMFVAAPRDMYSKQILAILLLAIAYLLQCSDNACAQERNTYPDLVPAANNHHHGHGRVQIKVYRGPSEGHEHFAPHGYWVKQPADDHRHHH